MTSWTAFQIGVIGLHFAGCVAVSLILSRRTSLREEQIIILSAAPIPSAIVIFSGFALIQSMTMGADACGVDACAMAAAGAWILFMAALLLFGLGIFVAKASIYSAKR